MRPAIRTVFLILVIAATALASIQANAVYPTSFGNKYPPALDGARGSATGRVTLSANTSFGVGGCYIAVVNASNLSEEYYNTTTDAYGNFQITGINATYSSVKQCGNPAVGNGSYEAGRNAYRIYAYKSPYGEGYSNTGSVGSDNGDYWSGGSLIMLSQPWTLRLTADRLVNDVNGTDCAKIYAYVYDDAGKPVMNGTVVDFMVSASDWTYANGSLNGNNSQCASATTGNGVASAYYGWFPGNRLPDKEVRIIATLRDVKDVNGVLDISFKGTSTNGSIVSAAPAPSAGAPTVGATLGPTPVPLVIVAPSPTATPATMSSADAASAPKSTPMDPAALILAVFAGMAIAYTARKR